MKLTATPFNPETGDLLPVYRDAYLRGDLARSSAQAVESYLRQDATQAHHTVTRWHELQTEEALATPNWVQKQLRFIREQPLRFRQRAGAFLAISALIAGVSMASTIHPVKSRPVLTAPLAELATLPTLEGASAARTTLVHGRILDEKGQPLAGATVLQKGTAHGTSTDASGNYALRVPVGTAVTLQYGFGGYSEQEIPAFANGATAAVTLQPKATAKRHRWLIF